METHLDYILSEDYIAVRDNDASFLWNKWKGVARSFWDKLQSAVTEFNIDIEFDSYDDFNCSCYEIVVKAMRAVKLSKIKNPVKWTFYIQYWHYLSNYTQRDIVKPALRYKMFTDSLVSNTWTPEFGSKLASKKLGIKRAPMSEEHKRKIAAAKKGKKFSEEHKLKIAESQRKRKQQKQQSSQ